VLLAAIALAFVVVPLVEISVLVTVGHAFGVWNALALVLVISIVGAWLTKHEGLLVVSRIREQLAAGRLPGDDLLDGALVLLAGALLLTPGFVTDGVGLLVLFPPTRALLRALVRRQLGRHVRVTQWVGPGGDDDVIDV